MVKNCTQIGCESEQESQIEMGDRLKGRKLSKEGARMRTIKLLLGCGIYFRRDGSFILYFLEPYTCGVFSFLPLKAPLLRVKRMPTGSSGNLIVSKFMLRSEFQKKSWSARDGKSVLDSVLIDVLSKSTVASLKNITSEFFLTFLK